jgi:pyrroloquinoline quinone biosynthesis protein A
VAELPVARDGTKSRPASGNQAAAAKLKKIVRSESGTPRCAAAAAGGHSASETGDRNLFPTSPSAHWSHVMKWETPQASDMRFGFEITMYIATR